MSLSSGVRGILHRSSDHGMKRGYVLSMSWTQERKRIDKPRRPAISSNHPVRNLLVARYGECRFIIGQIPERPILSGIG